MVECNKYNKRSPYLVPVEITLQHNSLSMELQLKKEKSNWEKSSTIDTWHPSSCRTCELYCNRPEKWDSIMTPPSRTIINALLEDVMKSSPLLVIKELRTWGRGRRDGGRGLEVPKNGAPKTHHPLNGKPRVNF